MTATVTEVKIKDEKNGIYTATVVVTGKGINDRFEVGCVYKTIDYTPFFKLIEQSKNLIEDKGYRVAPIMVVLKKQIEEFVG